MPKSNPKSKPKPKTARDAAALSNAASVPPRRPVPCTACAHCCTYVAIEVNPPNSLKRATELLWYLYHERISLYECDDEWMVQLETRCRNLGDDHRCGIYDTRPHICRDYSERDCEVNSEDTGQTFYTPDQFLAHLRTRRPGLYAKLERGFIPPQAVEPKRMPRRLPIFEKRFRDLRALGVS